MSRHTRIVIEDGNIVALDPKAFPVDYDLRGLTVMPGWIDAHVHINWFFGKNGKLAGATFESASQAEREAADADARYRGPSHCIRHEGRNRLQT